MPPKVHFRRADLVGQQLLKILRTLSCSLELLPGFICQLPPHQSLRLGQEVGQEDLTRDIQLHWEALSELQAEGQDFLVVVSPSLGQTASPHSRAQLEQEQTAGHMG